MLVCGSLEKQKWDAVVAVSAPMCGKVWEQ